MDYRAGAGAAAGRLRFRQSEFVIVVFERLRLEQATTGAAPMVRLRIPPILNVPP